MITPGANTARRRRNLARFEKRMEQQITAERKRGKSKRFSGNLEKDLADLKPLDLSGPFRARVRDYPKETRGKIGLALQQSWSGISANRHRHQGLGIRKLTGNFFEIRVGLNIRLVFQNRAECLWFVMAGQSRRSSNSFLRATLNRCGIAFLFELVQTKLNERQATAPWIRLERLPADASLDLASQSPSGWNFSPRFAKG